MIQSAARAAIMTTMVGRATGVLLLAASVAGCVDTYEVSGRQITVEADAGNEMCAGTLEHMDRFVERFAAEVGMVLPGEPWIHFNWISPKRMIDENRCGQAFACAGLGTVYSPAVPVDHELVHAAIAHVSLPHSFFIEGLAEAFALPQFGHADAFWAGPPRDDGDPEDDAAPPPGVIEVLRATRGQLAGDHYELAGAFTRYLIDRFGMKRAFELYQRSVWAEPLRSTEATFLDIFGVTLQSAVADFEARYAGCTEFDYPMKLLECEAPEIAWDGERWGGFVPLDCADAEAIGRVGSYEIQRSLTVPSDGTYRVEVRSGGAWVVIGSCGSCERRATAVAGVNGASDTAALPAGRYYVRIGSGARAPIDAGIVVERVADGLAPGGAQ